MELKKIFSKGKNPTEKDKMIMILFSSSTTLVLVWIIFFASVTFLSSDSQVPSEFFIFNIIVSLLLISSMAYSIKWFVGKKWKKR